MERLLDRPIAAIAANRSLLVPAAMLGLVAVLVAPLPPVAMDVLVAINFALAALVLVRASTLRGPLDFSVFPALLLGTTLFRLVINVASTRMILGAEATTPAEAEGVAGQFIEAFGRMVAGSSIVTGAVVFAILVVVQFVVITKGASRMAEVAARFALDALPGRQMAIDADVAAGSITPAEARRRRDATMPPRPSRAATPGAGTWLNSWRTNEAVAKSSRCAAKNFMSLFTSKAR